MSRKRLRLLGIMLRRCCQHGTPAGIRLVLLIGDQRRGNATNITPTCTSTRRRHSTRNIHAATPSIVDHKPWPAGPFFSMGGLASTLMLRLTLTAVLVLDVNTSANNDPRRQTPVVKTLQNLEKPPSQEYTSLPTYADQPKQCFHQGLSPDRPG